MLTYALWWLPMIVLAVLNGTTRDLGYKKYVGEIPAHQVSTVSLLILLAIYIGWVIRKHPPSSAAQAIYIGLLWLALTLAFEFGLGLARGHSMSHLLKDYNILKGRIWVLVPLWTAIAPYMFYKLFVK